MWPADLLRRLEGRGDTPCLVERGETRTAAEVRRRTDRWRDELEGRGVPAGGVVGLRADFSLDGVALLLAILASGRVAALLPRDAADEERHLADARAAGLWRVPPSEAPEWAPRAPGEEHPLLERLRETGAGGLVIFTSGSTGRPKAVLHDAERFLGKFSRARKRLRTLCFLLFDHVAGQDTLFYTLAAGGVLVAPEGRDPAAVCRLVERERVEVLPASPTFLRLLWASGAHRDFDLSSLRIVTYGSEPMDAATVERAREMFPGARLVQKYGTTELGAPPARSREADGLWLRFVGEEADAAVRDGLLWIRSRGAMLGYLNAPDPPREDGWICTGDEAVEEDGWIRVLGRRSDLINVGGEKVYPAEVEAVIGELDFVREVAVHGAPHPLTGSVVCARLRLARGEEGRERAELLSEVRRHCRDRLPRHKVPVKVVVSREPLVSERQKTLR